MQTLILNHVKKLYRRDNNHLYIYITLGEEVEKWNLKVGKNQIYNLDGVINISCKKLREFKQKDINLSIELVDPLILSNIKEELTNQEYLIIIKVQNDPDIILDMFRNILQLNRLIEMKESSVSKNSLKVISVTSLAKLINLIFNKYTSNDSEIMITFLKEYIYNYLNENRIYYPNNVKEMSQIKERYVIHHVNTWYILLNYFREQWESKSPVISIPLFNKEIIYKNWVGNFFDKLNPLWDEIYNNSGRKFYPSEQKYEKIYIYWKQLTKPS